MKYHPKSKCKSAYNIFLKILKNEEGHSNSENGEDFRKVQLLFISKISYHFFEVILFDEMNHKILEQPL